MFGRITAMAVAAIFVPLLLTTALQGGEPSARCGKYRAGAQVGKLFPGILEVSGLVQSTTHPNALWIHEDSGTASLLYAVGTSGELLGKWGLGDSPALYDWEDIAILPQKNKPGQIWLADIGDNIARESMGKQGRPNIKVIRVNEPKVGVKKQSRKGTLSGVKVFEFTYPNRPYDAEALTVDPLTGDLYIFTKVALGKAPVFIARAPIKSGPLQKIGDIDMPWVTAADMGANGQELIVRNYFVAVYWNRKPGQPWREVITTEPKVVPLKLERQGEAIAFRQDGAGFYTVSEGASAPVYYYENQCQ